jgi:hypothetical protein
VLAWLSTALAVLLFTLAGFPQLQARWTPLALAASFSPYALGLWLLAVLLTLVAGRGAARWWAVAPAAGLLLQAFTLTPYLPRPAESEPDHLSVATVNLRFGEAELARAADTALFSSEVLVLTEATAANPRQHAAGRPGRRRSAPAEPDGRRGRLGVRRRRAHPAGRA